MSIRRHIPTGFAVAAALLMAAPAAAQESPFSLEARTGVTIPTGDLGDATESGLLFAIDGYYSLSPTLSLYGGWAYHGFDNDVSASGPRVGLKALFTPPGDAWPWVRGGVTFNQGELGDDSSDRAAGLELGAGIDYALSPRVSVTPAARYETFSAEFGATDVTFSYLTLDLGIHLHF